MLRQASRFYFQCGYCCSASVASYPKPSLSPILIYFPSGKKNQWMDVQTLVQTRRRGGKTEAESALECASKCGYLSALHHSQWDAYSDVLLVHIPIHNWRS